MAPGPDWELWRHIDSAPLWQFVALLAGLDPDSVRLERWGDTLEWKSVNENFQRFLRIAISSVHADNLECQGYCSEPWRNRVLMPKFLRWAQSKGLPIPEELKPLLGAGDTSTGIAAVPQDVIEGYDQMRDVIKGCGHMIGDEAAIRTFLERAGVEAIDSNPKHGRRIWDRATTVAKVNAEIARRRQKEPK